MSRMHYCAELYHKTLDQVYMIITLKWKDEAVNLSHSSFLLFLYNHESELNEDDLNFLKKEYKKITGDSVTLTTEGEIDVLVQNSSRVRTWVQAKQHYKVGGLDDEMHIEAPSRNRVERTWQEFLDLGDWKGKRPSNDTRKKDS